MFKNRSSAWHWMGGVLLGAGVFFCAARSRAADHVVLRYSIFQESIAVADLAELAETGEASSSLKAYLKMANKEPEELRRALTQEVAVDGVVLYRVLNSLPGEFLLDRIGEIIQAPSTRASRQALRAAIVSSALPDGKVTLLEAIQNYPTSTVNINGDRIAEIAGKIDRVLGGLPDWSF